VTEGGPSTYTRPETTGGGSLETVGFRAIALIVLVFLVAAVGQIEPAPTSSRFLVVYAQDSTLVANIEVAAGIAAVLSRAPGREVYSEHMDVTRFPDPAHAERLAAAMAAKYRTLPIDAVLAYGPGALSFVLEHRDDFAPSAPVVFGGVTRETFRRSEMPADARGVISRFDVRLTVDLARQLQPGAERLVVLTGSAPFDRSWEARAREELSGYVTGLKLDFVSGLTLAEFQAMAATLDRRTILLILTVFEDAAGRAFIPRDAAAAIADASNAPAYGVYSSFIGAGLLGGHVETFTSIGEAMAELAVRAAAGEGEGPTLVETTPIPVVDWRQMRRFGLEGDLLPPGTQRLFYDPTVWERYWPHMLLAAGVILLQSGTIATLVIQERRRRRIAGELATERLELAHLSRTSQLGALSGALAHELNQPLASILANAEAGARLLGRAPPDLEEIAEILADIADDDRRAAAIITQLRRLMVKGDTMLANVDLNEVVRATITLARSELVARRTQVEPRLGQPAITVRGNLPQLQQVVLNLMLNAAEAMAELEPEDRRMIIETRVRHDGFRELAVADRGRGLSPEMRSEAFKPFVTNKQNGLGFGLSICRSIAQAHGGTLVFDEHTDEGARIVLTLPPP
jgi:signal transduction histidine kinase